MAEGKLVPVQIAFRSNPSRYFFAGNARLLNAYVEQQGNDAKAPLAVLPCPGLVSCVTVTDTPNRANIFCDDLQAIYSVHSSGVFKVTKVSQTPFVLTATRIGTIPGVDQVQTSRNQADPAQISIHSAAGEYYIEADQVKKVSDLDVTSETIVSQDNAKGYTIYLTDKGKFLFSSVNVCQNVDALDFATAEQAADGGTRVKSNGPDVFFFGTQTIEPWRVTGDIDLPFQVIGGSTIPKGMVAPLAVVECDNTLMFPTEDNLVGRLNGYNFTAISTPAISRFIEADTARESIQGLAYTFQGHAIANWTGDTYTIGYDAATGSWHERRSYGLETWRARNAVRAWGKTIAGDSQTGELFYLDKDTYDEDGSPMIWGVDTPFVHAVGGNGGIVDALTIDVATGGGALLATAGGYDPILMLSWSVDGGVTFKGNRNLKLGKRGEFKKIRTRRLGRFGDKGIMFRLRVSDPVIRGIVGIAANVRPLAV
jgi:hypothetical protein